MSRFVPACYDDDQELRVLVSLQVTFRPETGKIVYSTQTAHVAHAREGVVQPLQFIDRRACTRLCRAINDAAPPEWFTVNLDAHPL
jgi:hypothetical protein